MQIETIVIIALAAFTAVKAAISLALLLAARREKGGEGSLCGGYFAPMRK